MAAGQDYYDDLETRDPGEREAALMAALPDLIAHAKANTAAFGEIFKDVDPKAVDDRAALARLPVLRKSRLVELQKENYPFGGFNTTPPGLLKHIFASPGPIYDPHGQGDNYWRAARALYAAGVREGDIVHNSFSYHLTPAGWMFESAAHAIGCAVVPGGIGNTEQQIACIQDIRPSGYSGTPSFLKILLDRGKEMGADLSCLKYALVGAEPLPPSLREELRSHGLTVLQWYGTADIGLIAYETPALEGMVLDEELILEIVRPGTGEPVPEGEVGEVVVTTFNKDYPLIRFGTGDMSAVMPGASPCGRTNVRIRGWMGRADQDTKVRGMFVRPVQIAEVLERHAGVAKARLVVTNPGKKDSAVLKCEAEDGGADLAGALAETFRAVCKVRGDIELVPVGSLPNDGIVIEDARSFD